MRQGDVQLSILFNLSLDSVLMKLQNNSESRKTNIFRNLHCLAYPYDVDGVIRTLFTLMVAADELG